MSKTNNMNMSVIVEESEVANITLEETNDFKVALSLWLYISPVLLTLGTLGNIMSIMVLSRRVIWKLSTSPFLAVLAVADLLVLYSGLLRRWLLHLYDLDIRKLSDAGCRLHVFCVYASLHFSTWILVLVTFGRFLSVCFPLRAKTLCTRANGRISMIVAFIVVIGLNCHCLVFRELKTVDSFGENGTLVSSETTCDHSTVEYAAFFRDIWPWIDLAVSSGIPFTVIILCNSCIVWKVILSHRLRRNELSKGGVYQDRRISSMTAVLLVLNTVFLVTTAPSRIYLIGSPGWHVDVTLEKEAMLLMVWAMVNLLMYLNNAINFILYCVTGNTFRNELKAMCCSCRRQVYPTRAQIFVHPSKTQDCSDSVKTRRSSQQVWTLY